MKMGPFTLSPGQYSLTKGVLSVAGVLLLLILGIVTLRAGKKSARHTVANPGNRHDRAGVADVVAQRLLARGA